MLEFIKPSVVSKKGADPNSFTPSVFARVGVDTGLQSSVSLLKEADLKNNQESNRETIAYPDDLSVPQPCVTFSEQKNTLGAMSNDTTSLSLNLSSTVIKTASAISVSGNSQCGHQKNLLHMKVHSNQGVTDSESGGGSSATAVMLLALFLCVIVTVVIGYWKVRDFKKIAKGGYTHASQSGEEILNV